MSDAAVSLLFRVLVEITTGARPWAQGFYALFGFDSAGSICGSAHCLAGNLCLAAGYSIEPAGGRQPAYVYRHYHHLMPADAVEAASYGTVTGWSGDRDSPSIHTAAQELLGIAATEADELFDGGGTLAGLWEQAERLSAGRITIPADLVDLVDDRTQTEETVNA